MWHAPGVALTPNGVHMDALRYSLSSRPISPISPQMRNPSPERRFKILTVAALTFWGVSGLLCFLPASGIRNFAAVPPQRTLAQTVEFVLEPSGRRDYCGMPATDSACPTSARIFNGGSSPEAVAEDVRTRMELLLSIGGPSAEVRVDQRRAATAAWAVLSNRAKTLQDYWNRFSRLPRADDFTPASFDAQLTADPALISALNRLIHQTLETTHSILSSPEHEPLIESAAAFWWAARFLQIHLACPDQRTTPSDPMLRSWLAAQSGLQTCRRNYLSSATRSIQASLRANGADRIHLGSREWRLIQVLGSRRERANAFLAIQPDLVQSIRGHNTLAPDEIYFLGHLLLQVAYEKTHHQVLTWNGFQPATADDQKTIALQTQRLQELFVELLRSGRRLRVSLPAYHQAIRKTWTAIFASQTPESWVKAGLDSRDEMNNATPGLEDWETDCNEGSSASCETWLQTMIAQSREDFASARMAERWRHFFEGSAADGNQRNRGLHEGLRLKDFLRILPVYRAHLQYGLQNRRAAPAWHRTQQELGQHFLRAFRESVTALPPQRAQVQNCLAPSTWQKWQSSGELIPGTGDLVLNESCPTEDAAPVRAWAFRALILKNLANHSTDGAPWVDNVAAVIARQAAWYSTFPPRGPTGRAEPRLSEWAYAWSRAQNEFRYQRPNANTFMMTQYAGESLLPWLSESVAPGDDLRAVSFAIPYLERPGSIQELLDSELSRFF